MSGSQEWKLDNKSLQQHQVEQSNAAAWDKLARARHPLARPAKEEDFRDPLRFVDPQGWLGPSIRDWKVLCLAAGGGKHSALYAAAGAKVTVVDLSAEMLELDRQVCKQRGADVELIHTSMKDLSMLTSGSFDLVIQPVSTCYVSEIQSVFREVSRIVKPNGLYVSQHKQPSSLQSSLGLHAGNYIWQRNSEVAPVAQTEVPSRLREPGMQEFPHSLHSILGGICSSGFVIEAFSEPAHGDRTAEPGSFAHRCATIPPYLRVKARRTAVANEKELWVGAG